MLPRRGSGLQNGVVHINTLVCNETANAESFLCGHLNRPHYGSFSPSVRHKEKLVRKLSPVPA